MQVSKVAGVVGTLMTNMALEVAFREMQLGFVRAKVGDRYVMEQLNEKGWLYGGEGSGHLLCLDKHTTGDGTVSALQVLSGLKRTGKTLAQLTEEIEMYPQTLINVKVAPGTDWEQNAAMVAEKEAVEAELGASGRVLIRASGTEPLIRVMVEAKNAEQARSTAQRIADHLRA
jgi:phosphoglucosamine mutase